jgi:hypothetical protein
MNDNAEKKRLDEKQRNGVAWKKWGPYLSERQWGTVREDYSNNGDAWNYFTHDQARSGIPLGRGRSGQHQRRPPGAVLRAGTMERTRPDSEGARLRPGRQQGEPRHTQISLFASLRTVHRFVRLQIAVDSQFTTGAIANE